MTDHPEFPYSKQLAEVQAAAEAAAEPAPEPVVVVQTNDEVIIAAIDQAVEVIKRQAANRGQAMKQQVQGVGEAVVQYQTETRPLLEAAARSSMLAERSANNSHLTMSELRADMATLTEMFDATLSRRQRRRLKRYSDRMAKETE